MIRFYTERFVTLQLFRIRFLIKLLCPREIPILKFAFVNFPQFSAEHNRILYSSNYRYFSSMAESYQDAEIVKGKRAKFYSRIDGVAEGGALCDVVVITDRKSPNQMFPVYKKWISVEEGTVYVPSFNRKKDRHLIEDYLITSRCERKTTQIAWLPPDTDNASKKISIALTWNTFLLKCIHKDFGE